MENVKGFFTFQSDASNLSYLKWQIFLQKSVSDSSSSKLTVFCPNLENALKLKNSFFQGGPKLDAYYSFFSFESELTRCLSSLSLNLYFWLSNTNWLNRPTQSDSFCRKIWNNEIQIDVLTFKRHSIDFLLLLRRSFVSHYCCSLIVLLEFSFETSSFAKWTKFEDFSVKNLWNIFLEFCSSLNLTLFKFK